MLLRKISGAFVFAVLLSVLFLGCKADEDSTPFTGLKISVSSSKASPNSTVSVTASYYKDDSPDSSSDVEYSITDSTDGAYFGSAGIKTISAKSGVAVTLALGSDDTTVTINATCNGSTASAKVRVSSGQTISLNDLPVGYASVTPQTGSGTTVTTRAQLLSAVQSGGLIYVSGTIDMSEGRLPSSAGGTTSSLDAFVASNSSYSSYAAFKSAYAALCSSTTDDKSSSSTATTLSQTLWKLNSLYGNKIKLTVKSNTTIIGLEGAVIKGGTFQISGVSNVIIRNLTIQDAYDPFPHHEKNDGFNAQWDGIAIGNASNIWIDHCTLEDTMTYSKVTISGGTEEKWQTYDGLCDITNSSKNVVVSYCVFKNHDKTMLIGSSSSDLSGGNITIHHNRFLNCGQRLPMTCYPNMHIYNNSYERDSDAYYSQQACIAARYSAYTIIAENNYFGSEVTKCITASTDASGKCYQSGNVFVSGSCALTTQSTKPFTPSYDYTLDTASDIPAIVAKNAGAGSWSVEQ